MPTTVLIVDDQEPFRAAARAVISRLPGWHVVAEAATGEDALVAAAADRPAVVLMDINLPGIDGIEATRRIVGANPQVRVVLVSTRAAEDLPADAGLCGAVGYLRKDELGPARLSDVVSAPLVLRASEG